MEADLEDPLPHHRPHTVSPACMVLLPEWLVIPEGLLPTVAPHFPP